MKNNLIHWWELPKTTHIYLSKDFLLKLRNKRLKLNYPQPKLAKLISVKEATIRKWELNQRHPDINNLLKLLKQLKIPKESIYKNIQSIRGEGKSKKIINPPLPYNEKPEHIQIIAHGFFDGTLEHATDKWIGSLLYQSSDKPEQEIFKNLIVKCKFGIFTPSKNKKNQYSVPAILTQLLMNHYKIYSFNSKKSKFTNCILNKNKKYKEGILKAAYIDEGSIGKKRIRDNLTIFSSINPKLIEQISKILKLLEYEFFINPNKTATSIILYARSLQKFYKDIILSLPKGYYKKVNAVILLKRQKREKNIKKQLKEIEKIIKKQNKIKIIEVQRLFNLYESSARRRIERLGRLP